LYSVSCTATTSCIAVGQATDNSTTYNNPLVESFDGATWSIQPAVAVGTHSGLLRVSCTSVDQCTAIGHVSGHRFFGTAIAESWDGSSWTVTEPVQTTRSTFLGGIDCTSSANCVAVGFYYLHGSNIASRSLVEHWDGNAWSVTPSPSVHETITVLGGVSCGDADHCVAVGGAGYHAFAISGS
jgi:hypothetical protein